MTSVGGAKSCSGCEVGLLCSTSPAALPGVWVNSQVAGIETLRVRTREDLFFKYFPFSPHWGLAFTPVLKHVGLVCLQRSSVLSVYVSAPPLSHAAQSHVFSLVVVVPDLVQGCGRK